MIKRALILVTKAILAINDGGPRAFIEELGGRLRTFNRFLRPYQVAYLHGYMQGGQFDAFSIAGVTLAEHVIFGSNELPMNIFDLVTLARITSPQNKQEVDSWINGSVVATHIPQLPVKFARETKKHANNSNNNSDSTVANNNPPSHQRGRGRGRAGF